MKLNIKQLILIDQPALTIQRYQYLICKGMADQEDKKCAKCPILLTIMNITTALILVGFGIAGLVLLTITNLTNGKFFLLFSPAFMVLVGLMFLASEFNCEFMMKNFTFLKSYLGRGVFDLFMASSVFYFFSCGSNNDVIGWIAAILIFLLGIFYIGVHFCGGDDFKPSKQIETGRSIKDSLN